MVVCLYLARQQQQQQQQLTIIWHLWNEYPLDDHDSNDGLMMQEQQLGLFAPAAAVVAVVVDYYY